MEDISLIRILKSPILGTNFLKKELTSDSKSDIFDSRVNLLTKE